jgi:NADPH:quinone reductase-like Zn-dependent oxidoreductase
MRGRTAAIVVAAVAHTTEGPTVIGTMRRWELHAVGREHLGLQETDIPTAGPGEVLVKVHAVALNHRDKMVADNGRGLPLRFPFTPGSDLAGTVVECGEHADRFAKGDRVVSVFAPNWIDGRRDGNAREPSYRTLGGFYPGVLAEYVALPEGWLVRAPTTLEDAEAATLPCAGVTAWFALVERGHVQPGDVVLVEGTGGVSLFGVQIAKMHGATVIVSGSAAKLGRVTAVGADHTVDRRRADWVDAVLALTDDHGADHVLEVVGGAHLGDAVQVAAVGGHIHQIGALGGFEISTPAMPLMLKDVTIHGIGTGHRRALEDLVAAVDRTALRPVIDERYPLTALPEALDHLEEGPFGKIVIDLA